MSLNAFNPELMTKQKVLAISKCDMLDDELMAEMEKDLLRRWCPMFHFLRVGTLGSRL